MDDNKIYYPAVIDENPFPTTEGEQDFGSIQQTSKGEYSSQTIKPKTFPTKRIAYEVLGSALNTRSRRILAEFEFTQSGALQIGKYENGVSGDIRISPNGLVGRDSAGLTTFAIDGMTGNATFKGTIQAGSVIATNIDGDLITAGTVTTDKLSASYIEVGGADSDLQGTGINGGVNIGVANVKIDGTNKRIIINDGTNDRILLGFQSGGF